MIRRFALLSSVVFAFYCSSIVFGEATPLIQGDSLEGWEKKGGEATYVLEDGVIIGTSAPNTPNTFLCTKKKYGDFVLTYEFKCDKELNSGVQFRSQCYEEDTVVERDGKKKKFKAGRVHGYQAEIDANKPERLWAVGIYDESRRGWIFPGQIGGDEAEFTRVGKSTFKHEDWNSVKIVCKGTHIQTWLNDQPRADFNDDLSAKGFIGLQVHGVGAKTEPVQVRFRNLMIEEMSAE